jgi:hypothetical protein
MLVLIRSRLERCEARPTKKDKCNNPFVGAFDVLVQLYSAGVVPPHAQLTRTFESAHAQAKTKSQFVYSIDIEFYKPALRVSVYIREDNIDENKGGILTRSLNVPHVSQFLSSEMKEGLMGFR